MTYESGKYCEKKFFIVRTFEMSILFQFSSAGFLRIILKNDVSGEFDPPKKRWWLKWCLLLFPEKVLLVLQALKHNALLEDIRMFLFWEGNTAKNLDKNHQAEEESQKDVGSAGG